ncbi:hypothetical protein WJX73_006156 [Symbiochloris irregularis]|uniref:Exostosin GT47 domain-containing protein n=1 Tax=Symbiochloris irregularis TaxID=706552 RepID=A0AAW1PB53_9CHLO
MDWPCCWRGTIVALLLAASQLASATSSVNVDDLCRDMKIYVLDLQQLAKEKGHPGCNAEDQVVVKTDTGVVYTTVEDHAKDKWGDKSPDHNAHHKLGTHSAPWHFARAISNSSCAAATMEQADLIYVNDYCYYIWWLAAVHSHGAASDELLVPANALLEGWESVFALPRWKASHGRDFIFYDAHPGFWGEGGTGRRRMDYQCNEMKNAIQLIVDRPMRSPCKDFLDMSSLIITPNNPNALHLDISATFRRRWVPLQHRDNLLYFNGGCGFGANMGKRFRLQTVFTVKAAHPQLASLGCSDGHLGGVHKAFEDMLHGMEHSNFCLALPGDSQSTRRLSEMFMAGCIPVFVGPPYNSMPFAHSIDYASVGVFFNVTRTASWLEFPVKWAMNKDDRPLHPQDAHWWLPDANVSHVMIQVDEVQDIVPYLENMPEAEIERKLSLMHDYRFYMTFQDSLSGPSNANHQLLKAIRAHLPLPTAADLRHRHLASTSSHFW